MWLTWNAVVGTAGIAAGLALALQAPTADLPGWFGFSTLAVLCALAVEWGQRRRQARDLEARMKRMERISGEVVPRTEIDTKMNRLEDKIDARFDRIEDWMEDLREKLHMGRRGGSRGARDHEN